MPKLLEEMLHGDTLWGALVASVLLLVLRLALPRGDGRLMRGPLLAFLAYVVVIAARPLVPPFTTLTDELGNLRTAESALHRALGLAALCFVLVCVGRTLFLIVVHSALGRRSARPLPKIFRDIIQGLVYAAIALIVLRAAGVEPGSLLTTSALLTAVIGLSLQDTLGNMFAGLAIQMQRPFDVGDWIQFDNDGERIGHVVEINWRATKVQTNDLVEVVVPNAMLARAPITNFSRPRQAVRRSVYVQAPYDVPPHRVKKVLEEALRGAEGVLREPEPTVLVNAFGDNGVEYWLRFFLEDFARRDPIIAGVREHVWYSLHRAGIAVPFPQRVTHLHEVTEEAQTREEEALVRQREKALRTVDFLQVLPDELLQQLARRSATRLYTEGETVLRQGEESDDFFMVQRGEVAVLLGRDDGAQVELARLGPAKFFGEMSAMTGERRRASVRATRECEMLVVGKGALQQVLDAAPELVEKISEVLAQRETELGEVANSGDAGSGKVAERSSALLARIREFFSL